ncbi:hypothetical protein D3C77_738590 [compost metagenome]
MDHFGLGWQLGGNLFLGAPEQEGLDSRIEVLQALVIALALDRYPIVTIEGLGIAKPAG